MLSRDLTRYVDLHRSLGFKFHTQQALLRNFVDFAEAQEDELVRVTLCSTGLHEHRRLLSAATASSRSAASLWRCRLRNPRHDVPAADALGHGAFKRRIAHKCADIDSRADRTSKPCLLLSCYQAVDVSRLVSRAHFSDKLR
jgi:hypothetical protein